MVSERSETVKGLVGLGLICSFVLAVISGALWWTGENTHLLDDPKPPPRDQIRICPGGEPQPLDFIYNPQRPPCKVYREVRP